MVVPVELPDAIRHAVHFPESDLPGFPPGHPSKRVEIEGVFVAVPAGLPHVLVLPERIEESQVEHVVDAVRKRARGEQKGALWFVPAAASPAGLAGRLLALGMRPNDLPGGDARHAQMLCLEAPPPGPPDVVARPAETFEEFLAALLVVVEAFGQDEKARRAAERRAESLWPFQFSDGGHRCSSLSSKTRSSPSP
jgi:hypothetical protein